MRDRLGANLGEANLGEEIMSNVKYRCWMCGYRGYKGEMIHLGNPDRWICLTDLSCIERQKL